MAAAFIALFVVVAALRISYPFELEWMEGETLEHVRRVAAGQPLFVRPSLDFIPFTYPPLYYYACAAALKIVGGGFVVLRALSTAASLLSMALVYGLVRRESTRTTACVAAGMFAATYPLSGAWMDLGRVDSLYLSLALAAGYLLVQTATPFACVASGLLGGLALLTKQPIVISLAALLAYTLVRRPRALFWFAIGCAIPIASEAWLDSRSAGWFGYYVYSLPRLRMSVSSDPTRLWRFLWADTLLPFLPILAVAAMALTPRFAVRDAGTRERQRRAMLLCAGFILSSAAARLEGGAWTNALLPAHAALAIVAGIAISRWPRGALWPPLAAVVQLTMLVYDPRPFLPSARDVAAGTAIVDRIRALPDGVLVLDHGYLARAAGKRTYAHGWAMTDVLWADYRGHGHGLEERVRAAIAAELFPAVILDRDPHWFARDFAAHYPRCEHLPDDDAFFPPSGSRRRPMVVCFPR